MISSGVKAAVILFIAISMGYLVQNKVDFDLEALCFWCESDMMQQAKDLIP